MDGMNCWEYIKCKNKEKCPAYPDQGRECWTVRGTRNPPGQKRTPEEKKRDCVTLCKFMEGVLGGKL